MLMTPARRYALLLLGGVVAAACIGGCSPDQRFVNEYTLSKGLVLVLPGIEGASKFNDDIVSGIYDGGVDYAIEVYDWTSSFGPLVNLRSQQRNRQKAYEIADRITTYQLTYPGRPVILVGQSGGGAMALWTAEAMPTGHKVDGIVLLAATLSPGYDVGPALANTRRGIVSYYSSRDWIMLGLGTTIAGTMDGEHSQSAGRVGFEKAYDKLYQVPWTSGMAQSGNYGVHVTSGSTDFVAAYVVPFIKAPAWNKAVVESIVHRYGRASAARLGVGHFT